MMQLEARPESPLTGKEDGKACLATAKDARRDRCERRQLLDHEALACAKGNLNQSAAVGRRR